MSRFADRAAAALDAQYAEFGDGAIYTPPGGGAGVACTVIRDREDREIGMRGAAMQSGVVEVRRSELAAPAKGGSFAMTVGGETLTVIDDPHTPEDDPERLIWRMTVSAS